MRRRSGQSDFPDAFRCLPLNNPEELCAARSKPQTRVFVCVGSSADAVLAAHSVAASTKSKTPSRFRATRRRKAWSRAGTFPSLAAFSLGS